MREPKLTSASPPATAESAGSDDSSVAPAGSRPDPRRYISATPVLGDAVPVRGGVGDLQAADRRTIPGKSPQPARCRVIAGTYAHRRIEAVGVGQPGGHEPGSRADSRTKKPSSQAANFGWVCRHVGAARGRVLRAVGEGPQVRELDQTRHLDARIVVGAEPVAGRPLGAASWITHTAPMLRSAA